MEKGSRLYHCDGRFLRGVKRERVELGDAQGRSVEPLEEEKVSGVRGTSWMCVC